VFDTILMVDWSGGNDRGAAPKKDAIWTCKAGEDPIYFRNRQLAETYLKTTLETELEAGRKTLVGFDLCFSYPKGFAVKLTGSDDPLALWDWFQKRVEDTPKSNNRFHLAAEINTLFPGIGPFWFNALKEDIANLPRKGTARHNHGLPEYRTTDEGAFSPWQLAGAGAVGGQVIMGLPMLSRLRKHFGQDLSVWPFETPTGQIVLAETYFSLLPSLALDTDPIKDAAQVRSYANLFAALNTSDWQNLLKRPISDEGWVLGRGHEDLLMPTNPKLKNDCFALPPGVHWTPVKEALAHLHKNLGCVVESERIAVADAGNRILAQDVTAKRSHPPTPNSAIDGYGFKGPAKDGPIELTLLTGRAAAGVPLDGTVKTGEAIRILTGAALPFGVDTVVLQEDVKVKGKALLFPGPLKAGSNTRKAGEDMIAGDVILKAKRQITSVDIGTLTAAGVAKIQVQSRLRVGVLSTGDELRNANETATDAQIYDANRPMLLDTIAR